MLISFRAIYNYDNTIFDDLHIPPDMDKDTLVNLILLRLAELTVIYNEPETLKFYIDQWSATRNRVWSKLWDLANEEYDPLDNYNRTDTITTNHGHKIVMDHSKTLSETGSGTSTDNTQRQDYVYGYNSESRAHSEDADITDRAGYNNSNNTTDTGQDVHTNSGTDTETRHGKGNIGVTTYGKMIGEELELRPKLDIYNYIVEEIKCEFCVMVY